LRPQDQTRFARVGDWLIDLASNRLLRGEREIRPTPKAMAVLRQLMLAGGAPLTRTELLDTVWRDAFPTDDVLTHAITELRRAIEEDPKLPRHIETIPKVGYRLLTTVEWLEQLPGPPGANEVPAVATAASIDETPPQRPQILVFALVALALVALVVPALVRQPAQQRSARAPQSLQLSLPVRPVTAEPDSETFPSIAPDGSSVAYTAHYPGDEGAHIYLRGLSGSPPIRLSRGEATEELYPVWSPDGTQIAFLRMSGDRCRLVVVAALGGREREVSSCAPRFVDYFDWMRDSRALVVSRLRTLESNDGKRMAASEPSSLHLLSLEDGSVTPIVYERSENHPDIQPRVSPDGRRIAFRRGAVPYSDIFVMSADGGAVRQITRLRARLRGYDWLPDNRHMLVSSDHNGQQSLYLLDVDSGELTSLGMLGASYPAVGRGRPFAVFQQDNADVNLQSFRFDAATDAAGEGIASSTRFEAWPAFAPDDDRLVFVSNRGGDSQLWLFEPGARTSYQLTHHRNVELTAPAWSPDGRRVLYVARGNARSELYSVDVDSGQTRQESDEGDNVRYGTYSADGRSIYYVSDRDGPWQLWQRSIERRTSKKLSDVGAYNVSDSVGDGRLYFSNMNRRGLFAMDLATGAEEKISDAIEFWNMSGWRVDRYALYYLYGIEGMKPVLYQQPWSGGPPKALRQIEMATSEATFTLDKDASRVVVPVTARDDTDVMLLDLSALIDPAPQT
jgi:Tol biopolymer transport system component/DNA-binding winged helix-turn-helix (wHTH) protein